MRRWVVSKQVNVREPRDNFLRGLLSGSTTLYWAGPQPRCCPAATSWVWLSALDPLVAHFPTRDAAESAAHDFAGTHWRTSIITIAYVELPEHESTHTSTAESGEQHGSRRPDRLL